MHGPPISATKSLSGHSQGAAGVHEAIYSILMMQNRFICESANIEELDPEVAAANIVRKRIDNAKLGNLTATLANIRPAVKATKASGERTSKNAAFSLRPRSLNMTILTAGAAARRSFIMRVNPGLSA